MFEKPPQSPESFTIISYIWILFMATLGGFVSYLKKLKRGSKWSYTALFIELATAAFVGIVTFMLCQSAGMSQLFTAALVGISGHFSSDSLILFRKLLDKVVGKL